MGKIDKAYEFLQAFSLMGTSPLYLVGGAVRDLVYGSTPDDFDFCTPMLPSEVKTRLMEMGIVKRDIDMSEALVGTVTVTFNDEEYEITTFRKETYTPGKRKPTVEYVHDLIEDLKRRDFTINAMAIDWRGRLYAPLGGLKERNNPNVTPVLATTLETPIPMLESMEQDPLRILRGIRLGVKYEATNILDVVAYRQNLVNLSFQAIRKELEKGFKVKGTWKYFGNILKDIIPYYNSSVLTIGKFPSTAEVYDQWAFIMQNHIARSNFTQENNVTLITKSLRLMEFSKADIEEILRRIYNG